MYLKTYASLIYCVSLFYFVNISDAEKVLYFSVERPRVLYNDPRYIVNLSVTSRRIGRQNPIHYFNMEFDILGYAGNNVTVSLYLYEFLTNTYKRSFVEYHYKLCDFFEYDTFIGAVVKKKMNFNNLVCPLKPNHYEMKNVTIAATRVPRNFPIPKGRLFTNIIWTKNKSPIAYGYVDFELKLLHKNLTASNWFT